MGRYFLSIKSFFLLMGALLALFLAAGCGSDSSTAGSGNEVTAGQEVTVEAGSLSKAAFIKQADAICLKTRAEFDKSFNNFINEAPSTKSTKKLEETIGDVANTILLPVYNKMTTEISTLGAPSGDEAEIEAFLNALQERLAAIQDKPTELSGSSAFKEVQRLASAYGLDGCAESFS